MKVDECYNLIGGNYELIFSRVKDDGKIKRYLGIFLEEDICAKIEDVIKIDDMKKAYEIIHRFKGECMSLALERLYLYVKELNELLASAADEKLINESYKRFKEEYIKEKAIMEVILL